MYLRGLVRNRDTLPLGVRILEVLSTLTAFHSDQMAPVLRSYTGHRRSTPPTSTNICTVSLTILVLVVGAPADHFCHVLRLLVNGSGPQDGADWRLLAEKHLNQAGLGKLAVEFVEDLGVLRERRGTKDKHGVTTESGTCVTG